jgi:hypothetical protein
MVLAFSAIVGIPMWLTFQRPETYPDYAGARAHYLAKARRTSPRWPPGSRWTAG